VRERTAELEASNKELEAFSYSVSHDLRAPLRGIDGYSRLLLDDYGDALNSEGKYYLQNVRLAAQKMGQLIDDLLVLSRVTRAEMHREVVDLSELARESIEALREQEPERQVQISIQPLLQAQGDANLLRVMLRNLLSNAWKFTAKKDQASIEIGMQKQDSQSVYFIRDNGAGFNMKYADRLFIAFQRLHNPSEFEGTGIGLATVQRIISRHGGKIWAVADVDQGATFYFTLGV
jgi:light-regulated signal transduction histidine kinase (bacteriophytochrome)